LKLAGGAVNAMLDYKASLPKPQEEEAPSAPKESK
jgi:hypothetical protein